MFKKIFGAKEKEKAPKMKKVINSKCPKCGAKSIYRVVAHAASGTIRV